MSDYYQDTIAALATAAGRGGVGIVRVSGPEALDIAKALVNFEPKNRYAHYCDFFDAEGLRLDQGICLYFKGPHSFTGEDVVEFQAHGGPVILDLLLKAILSCGARLAGAGEFSQRAFFNDKLDLVQAEAISDLINSTSEQAARSALRSLQGDFSKQVDEIVADLIALRMYVEAAIDFPEEEVDFLSESNVLEQVDTLISTLSTLINNANQGALLTEGMRVVIAGRPNAGKSSLLNALAGRDSAIVTDIAGTTRDVLKEQINIDGMPLHIIDTAGLRESSDKVEQIGIDRAWQEIDQADRILLVVDASSLELNAESLPDALWPEFVEKLNAQDHITIVRNKVDVLDEEPATGVLGEFPLISLSAKNRSGLSHLQDHLKECVGYKANNEGTFTARRRHLDALHRALDAINLGRRQLVEMNAGELLAEELRIAQDNLGEITGKFRPDDLLGEIFSSFCIGK
jgi:tRNA modification GTPase